MVSINALAIDLRESGELEEAEKLFRELIASQVKVLEESDFQIGRALAGLAATLELANQLDEALVHRQAALAHRIEHEGPDDFWTNKSRLGTAELLLKLQRSSEAAPLLEEIVNRMSSQEELDKADEELLAEAKKLHLHIKSQDL